jgi:hypothetical protein
MEGSNDWTGNVKVTILKISFVTCGRRGYHWVNGAALNKI